MQKMAKDDAFYLRLREQLLETSRWPASYMFKFIVPTLGNAEQVLRQLFEKNDVSIAVRASSKGKYTSVSVSGIFDNPDVIIEKYRLAAKIPNIIQL